MDAASSRVGMKPAPFESHRPAASLTMTVDCHSVSQSRPLRKVSDVAPNLFIALTNPGLSASGVANTNNWYVWNGNSWVTGLSNATQIIGAPGTVRRGLTELLKATAADELMLTTMVFDPADRLRSFELVAELARTPSPEGQPAPTAT